MAGYMRVFAVVTFLGTFSGWGLPVPSAMAQQEPAAKAEQAFRQLLRDERAYHLSVTPGATPAGEPSELPDSFGIVAADDMKKHAARYIGFKDRLGAIDRSALSPADQLNYDLFAYFVNRPIVMARHEAWRIPFTSDSGFHTNAQLMPGNYRFETTQDYEHYLSWLKDLPRAFDEHIANMRQGLSDGFTMPKVILDGLLPTFKLPDGQPTSQNVFFQPFREMPDRISLAQQSRLQNEALGVISTEVVPAYLRLEAFMRGDYYQGARESVGISDVPGGSAYYRDMVRFYTTLEITPDAVHQIGLDEVARIKAEMQQIIDSLAFDGTFKDFLDYLRSDPQFYAQTPEELLQRASRIAKRIDLKMPGFFGKLPRQPYGVEPVPAQIAPNYTTGRYVPAPLEAPRGGIYWVNTYNLPQRPLYVLPALTLHEAVPGHHHQTALSRELKDVPAFRVGLYPHAFGEGWGLYSEKLGVEMGIYQTPYEHFGRLTYEMWRACRLVADTGLHAFGWSREKARECFEENSALARHNIRTEVDRYISWPGQALAYKMGELTILRLRREAKKQLGGKFDLAAFHDQVLSAGGMPMAVLEQRIGDWIAKQL